MDGFFFKRLWFCYNNLDYCIIWLRPGGVLIVFLWILFFITLFYIFLFMCYDPSEDEEWAVRELYEAFSLASWDIWLSFFGLSFLFLFIFFVFYFFIWTPVRYFFFIYCTCTLLSFNPLVFFFALKHPYIAYFFCIFLNFVVLYTITKGFYLFLKFNNFVVIDKDKKLHFIKFIYMRILRLDPRLKILLRYFFDGFLSIVIPIFLGDFFYFITIFMFVTVK